MVQCLICCVLACPLVSLPHPPPLPPPRPATLTIYMANPTFDHFATPLSILPIKFISHPLLVHYHFHFGGCSYHGPLGVSKRFIICNGCLSPTYSLSVQPPSRHFTSLTVAYETIKAASYPAYSLSGLLPSLHIPCQTILYHPN